MHYYMYHDTHKHALLRRRQINWPFLLLTLPCCAALSIAIAIGFVELVATITNAIATTK